MSVDTTMPTVPAFPAVSAPGKRIAFSAAAAACEGKGAGQIGTDDTAKADKAVQAAAIAILRALSHYAPLQAAPAGAGQYTADYVLSRILFAAAAEADNVTEDVQNVKSVQVRAAADKAATGDFRARAGRGR